MVGRAEGTTRRVGEIEEAALVAEDSARRWQCGVEMEPVAARDGEERRRALGVG